MAEIGMPLFPSILFTPLSAVPDGRCDRRNSAEMWCRCLGFGKICRWLRCSPVPSGVPDFVFCSPGQPGKIKHSPAGARACGSSLTHKGKPRYQAVFRRLCTIKKTIQKAREAFLELASRVFVCMVVRKWSTWSVALEKEPFRDRGNSRFVASSKLNQGRKMLAASGP